MLLSSYFTPNETLIRGEQSKLIFKLLQHISFVDVPSMLRYDVSV